MDEKGPQSCTSLSTGGSDSPLPGRPGEGPGRVVVPDAGAVQRAGVGLEQRRAVSALACGDLTIV
jgi:hypothetical protein